MKDKNINQSAFHSGSVAILSAGHALHDTYSAFLPPLLPVFIQNLLLSRAEAGLLTVFIQAPSVTQPFIGHLADRYHIHRLIFFCPAITAVMMSLLGIIPSYWGLSIFLVVVGLSSAAFHAVGPVLAGKLSGDKLGRGMSFWMVGGELGRTLGPLVIVTAIAKLTLRNVPWLMIAGLAAALLIWIRIRKVMIGHQPDRKGLSWRKALKRMQPVLLPLALLIIGRSFVMACATVYLPTFLTEEGSGLWFAGFSLTLLQAAGMTGALLSGSLSDLYGRRLLLLVSFMTSPFILFLFLMTGGWIRMMMLVLLGFSAVSATPVIMALVQESYPENRALANGIYMCLSFVLRSVVIFFVGGLSDRMGFQPAFMISSIIMLVSVVFIFLLPGGKTGKPFQLRERLW